VYQVELAVSPMYNWGSIFCGCWTHHTNTKNAVTLCGASWRAPPAAEVLEPGQESDILHYLQHCYRHYYLPTVLDWDHLM